MLFRAFGETEVIDQRALREDPLNDYGGFVLTGTDYMAREDAQAIVRFVERGGALICDHIPSHDLDGKPLELLQPLSAAKRSIFTGRSGSHVPVLGKEAHFSSRKISMSSIMAVSSRTTSGFVTNLRRPCGISSSPRPAAACAQRQLQSRGGIALHRGYAGAGVCESRRQPPGQPVPEPFAPPIPVVAVFDLVTVQPYPFRQTAEALEIEVDLGEREGLLLGLYPAVPAQSAIQVDHARVRAGESLAFTVELIDSMGQPARGDQIVEVRVTDSHRAKNGVNSAASFAPPTGGCGSRNRWRSMRERVHGP